MSSSASRRAPRRVLLVKLSSLGDVVHAIALADALRAGFGSDVHLAWAVRQAFAPLLDGCPYIDRVHVLPKSESPWRFASGLRAENFDTAIDAQGLLVSGVVTWRCGARRRLGFDGNREGNRLFLTDSTTPGKVRAHMVERLLGFCDTLEIPKLAPRTQTWLIERGAETASALLPTGDAPWIGCIVGASTPEKAWPVSRWAALAKSLHADGFRVALLGGPGETDAASAIESAAGASISANLVGKTPIPILGATFARCAAVVGGDSGPTHLAVSVGVPVVGLYGVTDPVRTGPNWGAGPSITLDFAEADAPPETRRARHTTLPDALARIPETAVADAVGKLVRW